MRTFFFSAPNVVFVNAPDVEFCCNTNNSINKKTYHFSLRETKMASWKISIFNIYIYGIYIYSIYIWYIYIVYIYMVYI